MMEKCPICDEEFEVYFGLCRHVTQKHLRLPDTHEGTLHRYKCWCGMRTYTEKSMDFHLADDLQDNGDSLYEHFAEFALCPDRNSEPPP